ncbi:MAG: lipid A deacylase LpxR family protein [Sulfurimonas sp.]|nr:lipid A deacylase LpxR family protein [Sulfurimonas sp.]
MKPKLRLILIFFAVTLNADQFSFAIYNDSITGRDQHFTSGVNVSWIDDSSGDTNATKQNSYSNFVYKLVDNLSFGLLDDSKEHSAGVSLSQVIITPSDLLISTPQYDDMPYAGHLYISSYLFEFDKSNFKEFRVEFGVVGKESVAEESQKLVHKIINSDDPKGWDNQLGTQYTLDILFRYGEISWESRTKNGLSMDWFNQLGFQAGNFTTDAFGGTMFRIGDNYIRNFNLHYPYLKEEASMLKLSKDHSGFGWSLTTGLNAELLAYSYILDEADDQGYDSDKNFANASAYLGADLYYDKHKFTLFYRLQSPYSSQSDDMDIFGGVLYSFQF